MEKQELGRLIKMHRQQQGLTLARMSELSAGSTTQIQLIEKGTSSQNPKAETLQKIAQGLGLDDYESAQIYRAAGMPAVAYIEQRAALTPDEAKLLANVRKLPPAFFREYSRMIEATLRALDTEFN